MILIVDYANWFASYFFCKEMNVHLTNALILSEISNVQRFLSTSDKLGKIFIHFDHWNNKSSNTYHTDRHMDKLLSSLVNFTGVRRTISRVTRYRLSTVTAGV